MRLNKSIILLLISAFCLSVTPVVRSQSRRDLNSVHSRLAQEVRHELTMLPRYSVFDILEFEVSGVDTVTLLGQVTRPSLKSDAETAVRSLEGVGRLVNKIEVLPISPTDEKIRIIAYQAIFSRPGLDLYAYRAVLPIHIIVKNGSITLVGVVASQADKDMAGLAAKDVPATFGVTNNLRVENK